MKTWRDYLIIAIVSFMVALAAADGIYILLRLAQSTEAMARTYIQEEWQ